MATIVTRAGKGSPLTNNEVDANFTNLNTDKAELSGSAFTGAVSVTLSDNTTALSLITTDDDASLGPILRLYRNSASPADNDVIGQVKFSGENDADEEVDYVKFITQIIDASDASEDGQFSITSIINGTHRNRVTFTPTVTVFNQDAQDIDLRVESSGNTAMLFVNAGNNRVGVGTSGPDGTLHVFSGSAGSVSPVGGADDLIVENGDSGGISIFTPDNTTGQIVFGSPADVDSGRIQFNHANDQMVFRTNSTIALTIDSSQAATFSGTITSGDITISSAGPAITLTDTDNNPDYQIKNGNGTFRVIDTTNSVDRINITSSLTTFANAISSGSITSSGTITSATNAPQLILSDTGNGGGGGAEGKVLFANTNGNAIGIGYTGDVTADSDLIISTNGSGTYGGYLGLDAAAIADAKADIVLEPKTSVRIFTDSDALKLSSITNAQPVRITFTSDTSSPFQEGHLEYTHADGASYGSNEAFIFGGTEATMTVLVDGKLMTKDGLFLKPGSGTGAGTQIITSAGNLTNIGTITATGLATVDRVLTGTGTAASPAVQIGDTNSGLFDSGADAVGIALAGATEYNFTTTSFNMNNNELDNVGSMDLNATATNALHVIATDDSPNSSFAAVLIDHNASGSTALTADRAHVALSIDFDSTATGGTTSDEHRIYGINANVKATGDSDLIHGSLFTAEAEHSAGQVSALYGVFGTAVADLAGSAILSNAYAGFFYAQSTCASGTDPSGLFGVYGKAELQAGNDVDWTQVLGGYFEVEFETSGTATTVDNAYVIRGLFDQNSTDTTITNGYLINLGYSGSANITNRYGIYLTGATQNRIEGTIQGSDGSTTRVSYGFISDINTGMFSPANHEVALAANGTTELTVSAGLVTVNRILTGLGSQASPAVQVGDTNTGIFDSGANTLGITCNGGHEYDFTAATFNMLGNTITNNGGIEMNANTVLSVGTSPGDAFNGDASIRIGDTGNNYVQAIVGTGNQAGFLVGDADDDFDGGFIYSNNSRTLTLHAANTAQLDLSNGSAVFTASVIDIPSSIRHVGDTDTRIDFHAANQIRFVTGGSERLEQNQGTTTIAGTLAVRQAIDLADNDVLRFGSGDDIEMRFSGSDFQIDVNNGEDIKIRDGNNGNANRFTFDVDNGEFTATGDITAFSDRRVKRDFMPITNALAKVDQLEGLTFIRTDLSDDNVRHAGLIAQDVEAVLPEAVAEKDGHLTLNYNGTIGLLVEAIKELKDEVDYLKAQLDTKKAA